MEFGLALLLFSGLVVMECVMVHHHDTHFVFVDKNMTWKDAQQHCREMYNTDLATIGNMEDVQMMKTSAKGYSGLAWIGLHQSGEPSWKWSLAEEGSNSLEETVFTEWEDKPDGGDGQECGLMNKKGEWAGRTCKEQKYTVCYDESNKNFVCADIDRSYWRDAQIYCRKHHTDLASVKNNEENDKIKELIDGGELGSAWIGLFRDNWVWSDQNRSSFRYWGPHVPANYGKESCAAAKLTDEGEGRWWDRTCTKKLPFFCRSDGLVLVNKNLSWREAFMYCSELNMYLVSIFTQEVQQRVVEKAQAASSPQVWVGLRYLCALEMWIWSTGETVCYDKWDPEGQNGMGNCREWQGGKTGAVTKDGKWVSLPESTPLNFICATKDAM